MEKWSDQTHQRLHVCCRVRTLLVPHSLEPTADWHDCFALTSQYLRPGLKKKKPLHTLLWLQAFHALLSKSRGIFSMAGHLLRSHRSVFQQWKHSADFIGRNSSVAATLILHPGGEEQWVEGEPARTQLSFDQCNSLATGVTLCCCQCLYLVAMETGISQCYTPLPTHIHTHIRTHTHVFFRFTNSVAVTCVRGSFCGRLQPPRIFRSLISYCHGNAE